MAKQQHKQSSPAKKQTASSESDSFTYLWRNFAVVIVIAILLFGIDRMNAKQGQLNDLYNEFQQLRQSGGNQQRQQELYNEIIEIQNDTSFFKKLTRGYYWAVHDVAIKGRENVREIQSKVTKPLTREDKFAMRVGIWGFIDYINKNTPDTAIIYLPEADSVTANNSKWNYIYEPEWMEYFIYPRLCVAMGKENQFPELAKRVTHAVIIEGKGYDKLKYEVPAEQRAQEAVLPINAPDVGAKN